MKIKSIIATLLWVFISQLLYSQSTQKYWLTLAHGTLASNYQLSGIQIQSRSNWLNAVSVILSQEQINVLALNPEITSIEAVKKIKPVASSLENGSAYGDYVSALRPEYLEKIGVNGKGVIAGVIDAGFVNVDSGWAYQHLVTENRILGYKDFILDTARKDFFDQQTSGDFHGAQVLAYMGGFDPKTKQPIGLATGASYYLARTENGDKEHLVEEDDWIEAIEWMYGNGVRVVNTSLGYSEFDDEKENHTIYDMNGKTTKISIAAQKAVEKGMILVCSAGNLGLKTWTYVSAPADAEGVISVGATKKDDWAKEGYSSVGPEFNPYIKPDISTYSDRGTSYSSPEIAGLVACMLQNYPSLTPQKVKQALAVAGHLNPLPNNFVGYGVPDPELVFDFLAGKTLPERTVIRLSETDTVAKIKVSEKIEKGIVVFHKSDLTHVKDQIRISNKRIEAKGVKKLFGASSKELKYKSKIRKKGAIITLYKPQGVKFSTVVINKQLFEIEWR
jgi:subtilisin family serine protease